MLTPPNSDDNSDDSGKGDNLPDAADVIALVSIATDEEVELSRLQRELKIQKTISQLLFYSLVCACVALGLEIKTHHFDEPAALKKELEAKPVIPVEKQKSDMEEAKAGKESED